MDKKMVMSYLVFNFFEIIVTIYIIINYTGLLGIIKLNSSKNNLKNL